MPVGLSNYDLISCILKIHNFKYQPKLITCRDYANYDSVTFRNELRCNDFGSVLSSSCVNDVCSRLKCILQQSIDKHGPLITKKIKGRLCPWMSSEVKSEMNLRDQLLRKACRTNREIDWSSYKQQHNKMNSQLKKYKSNYYKDLLQDKAFSPDKVWTAIKKLYPTKITTGSAAAININRTKTSNTFSIAQGFCDFFSTTAGVLKTKSFGSNKAAVTFLQMMETLEETLSAMEDNLSLRLNKTEHRLDSLEKVVSCCSFVAFA